MKPNPNADDEPINQVNIRNEVYERIRRGIIGQQYPPGYRFKLNELEARLGVSRTPIKEALQRLQAEALVEIRPRRGTFVISIDRQEVEDTWEMRRLLEGYAAEVAVARATDEDVAELWALMRQLEPLYSEHDVQDVVEQIITLDHTFHARFVAIAHNRRLSDLYDTIGHFVQLIRVQSVFHLSDLELARSEHHAIMDGLQQRDAPALVAAVDHHITRSIDRLFQRFDRNPEK